MPQYDFRCDSCGQPFCLTYKTVAEYARAEPCCPACGAEAVSRVIKRVSIAKVERDYSAMSSHEMLSVLEGGDEKQVGAMYRQVGASAPPTQPAVIPKQTGNRNADSPDTSKSNDSDAN